MERVPITIKGRGVAGNPKNRFEAAHQADDQHTFDVDQLDPERVPGTDVPRMHYFADNSKSIIASNDSPDVGFNKSINPYRGCTHGCVYCFARPTHEYLGFSSGLDFETKIMVKHEAAALLRKELAHPKYVPEHVGFSGVTDCYQPIERKLGITRACLEVLVECRHPVVMITKNHLITRDVDLLAELAKFEAVRVCVSITTLDAKLTRVMEPRTSVPKMRLAAIKTLADAGVPVCVLAAPMIPGLNDHEMPAILQAAADSGATFAGYVPLRLPYAIKEMFEGFLRAQMPGKAEKILHRIREMRGGKLNDSEFGSRMSGTGIYAEQLRALFHVAAGKAGLNREKKALSIAAFRRPVVAGAQGTLFG